MRKSKRRTCTSCGFKVEKYSDLDNFRSSDGTLRKKPLCTYCYSAQNKKYRARIPKEVLYSYYRVYQTKHRARVNNRNAKRRAKKLQATPGWLTAVDLEKIEMLYTISSWITKRLGIVMNVDHIIPLQGELVSGFHCPSNLQVIREEDNLKKGNKFDITE